MAVPNVKTTVEPEIVTPVGVTRWPSTMTVYAKSAAVVAESASSNVSVIVRPFEDSTGTGDVANAGPRVSTSEPLLVTFCSVIVAASLPRRSWAAAFAKVMSTAGAV